MRVAEVDLVVAAEWAGEDLETPAVFFDGKRGGIIYGGGLERDAACFAVEEEMNSLRPFPVVV